MGGEDPPRVDGEPPLSTEAVLDKLEDVFYVVAPGERLVRWNDRLPAVTGYADEEIADMRTPAFLPPEERDRVPAHAAEVRETGAASLRTCLLTKDDERIPFEFRERRLTDDGQPVGRCGVGRDVSEQVRDRQHLAREKAFADSVLDTVPDLLYAFDESGQFLRWNDEVTAVTGYDDEQVAEMRPLEFIAEDDREAVAEAIEAVVERGETRIVEADLLTRDGERIPHEFTGSRFVGEDGNLHGVVGVGRDVSGRERRERELQRQRDELRRLHRINGLIRQVNRALVRADSREAVGRALADCLTDDGGYAFAWVGEPDLAAGRLEPREVAGDGDGYLDDVTVTFDGDATDGGPAARAVTTRSIQVARDLAADDEVQWRTAAARRDLRSGAAVPVTHDGALYAVLNVYAHRSDAFDDRERTVLSELAGTVGHALHAVLCQDVLTGEEVVELEFRLAGGPKPLIEATRDASGRITLEHTVRAGDGRQLWYVTVDGMDPDCVDAFEAFEPVQEVSLLASDDDHHRFEIVATHAPLVDALDPHGGRVRHLSVEDGDLRLVAAVPPSADLRAVARSVADAVPSADLIASRTTTRESEPPSGVATAVSEALTERQITVLEAAHGVGYFERPRPITGEELADSLGIARSTFHQHLRAATRKLVDLTVGEHT